LRPAAALASLAAAAVRAGAPFSGSTPLAGPTAGSLAHAHCAALAAAASRGSLAVDDGPRSALYWLDNKSQTILRAALGLEPLDQGNVQIGGQPPQSATRGGITGVAFQDSALLPWRTVAQNIELPLNFRKLDALQRRERVDAMLKAVDLAGFAQSYPNELSGGMRKRVALAQVLVYDPGTLLMDEPFGALDAQLKLVMQQRLLDIWQASGKTVIFVTHDLAEAVTLAQRVVVFSGRPGSIKTITPIDIPGPRDPFKVRFHPKFQEAYEQLWSILAPEIAKGEDL
jgi:NitT/TauT family transport system ATP-binding protein